MTKPVALLCSIAVGTACYYFTKPRPEYRLYDRDAFERSMFRHFDKIEAAGKDRFLMEQTIKRAKR